MTLTAAQRDRACGALLGAAAGDALGAGYEFGPPLAPDAPVDMIGGGLGPFKPGEWTDDTSMAIAIAEIAATGTDLRDEAGARTTSSSAGTGGRKPPKTLVSRPARSCPLRVGGGSPREPRAKSRRPCTSAPAEPPATAR